MKASELAQKILDHLGYGDRWIKSRYTRMDLDNGHSHCLEGALRCVGSAQFGHLSREFSALTLPTYKAFQDSIEERTGERISVAKFNDDPDTEWHDIEMVVKDAITKLEEKGV